jgi:general secretion pathway protein A
MYKEFYGLSEDPFQISPDPRFLYMSDQHREAYAHLTYALNKSKGFTIITGDAGTGKTTLILMMLARLDGHTRTAHLFNPKLSTRDFLHYICRDLGLKTEGLTTKGELLTLLHKFLLECYARKERVVLIIDEAQTLSPVLLEEVRLLTNLETPTSKLLQVILLGQPELEKVLSEPRFRQLRQRISVRYHLDPLNLDQTNGYIEHRLKVAGNKGARIFEPEAVRLIWKFSRGIPRVINTLCDAALVIGHATSRKVIDGQTAKETIRDMGYLRPKARTFFSRPVFLYAVSGIVLAGALGLGTLMVWKRVQGVPPATAVEKAVVPEKTIAVRKNVALASLARQHYGLVNPTVLDILLEHNPHITDVNRIPADEPIEVPPLTDEQFLGRDPDGTYHLYLGTFDDQQSIQSLTKHPLLQGKTLKTTLRSASGDTPWYRLTASGFPSKKDALKVLASLREQGLMPPVTASP